MLGLGELTIVTKGVELLCRLCHPGCGRLDTLAVEIILLGGPD